jgi:hypothetical protein
VAKPACIWSVFHFKQLFLYQREQFGEREGPKTNLLGRIFIVSIYMIQKIRKGKKK